MVIGSRVTLSHTVGPGGGGGGGGGGRTRMAFLAGLFLGLCLHCSHAKFR